MTQYIEGGDGVLIDVQAANKIDIDSSAGEARARHGTNIYAQDSVYQEKESDARQYVTDGYPTVAGVVDSAVYPWIAAEESALVAASVDFGAKAAGEYAADEIITAADARELKATEIEEERIKRKRFIDAATTLFSAHFHKRTGITNLDAI